MYRHPLFSPTLEILYAEEVGEIFDLKLKIYDLFSSYSSKEAKGKAKNSLLSKPNQAI